MEPKGSTDPAADWMSRIRHDTPCPDFLRNGSNEGKHSVMGDSDTCDSSQPEGIPACAKAYESSVIAREGKHDVIIPLPIKVDDPFYRIPAFPGYDYRFITKRTTTANTPPPIKRRGIMEPARPSPMEPANVLGV